MCTHCTVSMSTAKRKDELLQAADSTYLSIQGSYLQFYKLHNRKFFGESLGKLFSAAQSQWNQVQKVCASLIVLCGCRKQSLGSLNLRPQIWRRGTGAFWKSIIAIAHRTMRFLAICLVYLRVPTVVYTLLKCAGNITTCFLSASILLPAWSIDFSLWTR